MKPKNNLSSDSDKNKLDTNSQEENSSSSTNSEVNQVNMNSQEENSSSSTNSEVNQVDMNSQEDDSSINSTVNQFDMGDADLSQKRDDVGLLFRHNESEEKEPEDDSYILPINLERLQEQLERIKNEIQSKNKEYDELRKKTNFIRQEIHKAIDPDAKYNLRNKRTDYEEELNKIEQKIKELTYSENWIEQKLEKAEYVKYKKIKSNDLVKGNDSISLKSLFNTNEPIESTLLYVGTFFPGLSPQDFEQVVSYLLKDRTIRKTKQTKITTENLESKIIEEAEEKLLSEIWQSSLYQPEFFLSKCYLRAEFIENSSQVIEFSEPGIREKLKEYFQTKEAFYLSKQFERARLLLFHESQKVAENAMYLSIDMALLSPYNYGKNWLFQIVTELTEAESKEIVYENPKSSSFYTQLQDLIEVSKRRKIIFSRISSLIAGMLSYPQLQDIVKSFLDRLMSVQRFDAVMEIVKLLKTAPKFQQLYWVKQLLARGNDPIRNEAYGFLFKELKFSKTPIYELLEIIKQWLPDRDTDPQKYTPLNQRALWLLLDYCLESTATLNINSYGRWPSEYRLFQPLESTLSEFSENLEILVLWLFHPGIKFINKEIKVISLIGLLLLEWHKILCPENRWFILRDLEVIKTKEEANKLFDIILEKIVLNTDKSQQKELISYWKLWEKFYLYESQDHEKNSRRNKRKISRFNRKIIKKVRTNFNSIQKSISIEK